MKYWSHRYEITYREGHWFVNQAQGRGITEMLFRGTPTANLMEAPLEMGARDLLCRAGLQRASVPVVVVRPDQPPEVIEPEPRKKSTKKKSIPKGCLGCHGRPWIPGPNGGMERCLCEKGMWLREQDEKRAARLPA